MSGEKGLVCDMVKDIQRENHIIDRCVRKDSMSCDPSHIIRESRSRVMRLGS